MKNIAKQIVLVLCVALSWDGVKADGLSERLVDTLEFHNELTATTGGGTYAPFWMSNNRNGLASIENRSLVWRRALKRDIENDNNRRWKIGWGIEFSNLFDTGGTDWIFQELYADIQYRKVRLSVGQKERGSYMLDSELSSGGLASGINARPIPQVRLELPDFWTIPSTGGWLALRGYLGYGVYTDNKWQRDFAAAGENIYSRNSLYHTKAGFLRVGNTKKFPLVVVGGLEMNTQFGGTAFNVKRRADDVSGFNGGTVDMGFNIKDFWNVLIPGGSDMTDGAYSNRAGNTVGAWHLSVGVEGKDLGSSKDWSARVYAQHLFEDESQMFWQYGWRDFLIGTEIELPKNPIVSKVVYEYLATKDQSGPIYHDKTTQISDQISAADNYYNHAIYGAWQHAGYGLGNALLISPIYNADGSISFKHNRVVAHHVGLRGQPVKELSYKVLFSYEKSWGTYSKPLVDPLEGWTVYTQAVYSPTWLKNCSVGMAYGHNGGKLLGNSNGLEMSFYYNLKFHTKKQ